MKYNLSGTSIIEAMVVLLVVVTWITWVYWLLASSQKLANSTSQRIEAIQIARDGLESFTNIRDTNWILFAADYENCWNVLNYNNSCIGDATTNLDIRHDSSSALVISRWPENKFILSTQTYPPAGSDFSDVDYRNDFAIQKDSRWFYTQSGGTLYGNGTDPFYTREIQIDYLSSAGASLWSLASNNNAMQVSSIVQWQDASKAEPQKLEMQVILTNWKSKK